MNVREKLRKSTLDRDALAWRIAQVERSVSRGVQDPRDLEAVKSHGIVTRPSHDACTDCRCLPCYPPPIRKR
jgi:hypothetical protein